MQQTIQGKPSYTSAWVCLILGFIFPVFWVISIILFITKSNEYNRTINFNNININFKEEEKPSTDDKKNIKDKDLIAEHTEN